MDVRKKHNEWMWYARYCGYPHVPLPEARRGNYSCNSLIQIHVASRHLCVACVEKMHFVDLKYFYSCHWLSLDLRESIFPPNPFIVVEWIAGERKNEWLSPTCVVVRPPAGGDVVILTHNLRPSLFVFIYVYLRLFTFIYTHNIGSLINSFI